MLCYSKKQTHCVCNVVWVVLAYLMGLIQRYEPQFFCSMHSRFVIVATPCFFVEVGSEESEFAVGLRFVVCGIGSAGVCCLPLNPRWLVAGLVDSACGRWFGTEKWYDGGLVYDMIRRHYVL